MSTKSQPTIVLHRGPNRPGHYVWSPFVTKTEFRLRLAGLPYICGAGSPSSGPKGKVRPTSPYSIPKPLLLTPHPKIPYISLSTSPPSILSDSTLIPKTLIAMNLMPDLNARLSPKDAATDLALRTLLEDKLHYCNIKERWIDHFPIMRDYVLSAIPMPAREAVGNLAYTANVRKLDEQGMSRFSDEEVSAFRREIWESVNAFLGESREKAGGDCWWVLGGDGPTEVDTTVYGYVVSALVAEAGPESGKLVKGMFPGVVEWAEGVHERWFGEYEIWK
jgi:hypothetical protein